MVQVQLEANSLKNWAILYGHKGWDQDEKRRNGACLIPSPIVQTLKKCSFNAANTLNSNLSP